MERNQWLKDLLDNLFNVFEQQKVEYLILRNYEGLPEKIRMGGDIDFLIDINSYRRIATVLDTIEKIEILISSERLVVKEYIVRYDNKLTIKLDFHPFEDWHGAIYCQSSTILRSKRKHSCFFVPSEFHQAMTMLMASFLYGGFIKQKYMPYAKPILASSSELDSFIPIFGNSNINNLREFAKGNISDEEFLKRRKGFLFHLFMHNLRKEGISFITRFIKTRIEEIYLRFRYNGSIIELNTEDNVTALHLLEDYLHSFIGHDRIVIIDENSTVKQRIKTWDDVARLRFIIYQKGNGKLLRKPDIIINKTNDTIQQFTLHLKQRTKNG